jgi:hypothetical protein
MMNGATAQADGKFQECAMGDLPHKVEMLGWAALFVLALINCLL